MQIKKTLYIILLYENEIFAFNFKGLSSHIKWPSSRVLFQDRIKRVSRCFNLMKFYLDAFRERQLQQPLQLPWAAVTRSVQEHAGQEPSCSEPEPEAWPPHADAPHQQMQQHAHRRECFRLSLLSVFNPIIVSPLWWCLETRFILSYAAPPPPSVRILTWCW